MHQAIHFSPFMFHSEELGYLTGLNYIFILHRRLTTAGMLHKHEMGENTEGDLGQFLFRCIYL